MVLFKLLILINRVACQFEIVLDIYFLKMLHNLYWLAYNKTRLVLVFTNTLVYLRLIFNNGFKNRFVNSKGFKCPLGAILIPILYSS